MAQTSQNSAGFALPVPAETVAKGASPTTATVILSPGEKFEGTYTVVSNTSTRDMLIGTGVLLVLLVAFFVAKNAYANTLVGKRVPPNKANAAAWWMFMLLASISAAVVLAAVDTSKIMNPMVFGPFLAVCVLSLVLMLTTGRK